MISLQAVSESDMIATHLEVSASLVSAVGAFIRAITTIVLRVALPGVGHTASIAALELRGAAGDVDAACLIGEVAAIVLRVALERSRDASPGLAHEFRCAACCFLKR